MAESEFVLKLRAEGLDTIEGLQKKIKSINADFQKATFGTDGFKKAGAELKNYRDALGELRQAGESTNSTMMRQYFRTGLAVRQMVLNGRQDFASLGTSLLQLVQNAGGLKNAIAGIGTAFMGAGGLVFAVVAATSAWNSYNKSQEETAKRRKDILEGIYELQLAIIKTRIELGTVTEEAEIELLRRRKTRIESDIATIEAKRTKTVTVMTGPSRDMKSVTYTQTVPLSDEDLQKQNELKKQSAEIDRAINATEKKLLSDAVNLSREQLKTSEKLDESYAKQTDGQRAIVSALESQYNQTNNVLDKQKILNQLIDENVKLRRRERIEANAGIFTLAPLGNDRKTLMGAWGTSITPISGYGIYNKPELEGARGISANALGSATKEAEKWYDEWMSEAKQYVNVGETMAQNIAMGLRQNQPVIVTIARSIALAMGTAMGKIVTEVIMKSMIAAGASAAAGGVVAALGGGIIGGLFAALATSVAMADGGTIREPIFGVGKSGQTYTFGERGAEYVVPAGGFPSMSAGMPMLMELRKLNKNIATLELRSDYTGLVVGMKRAESVYSRRVF